MANLFEIASKKKYRFPYKGPIGTEDLWDLAPAQLDSVYKALNKMVKVQGEDSLMNNSGVDEDLKNQIEIVRYIYTVKKEEAAAKKTEAENKEKKKLVMEILAEKQNAALRNMSEEDLQKMLEELK